MSTLPRDRTANVAAGIALLPVLMALLAEAAWISVVAGLVEAFAARDPGPGIAVMLAWAIAGTLAAALLGRRLGDRWPTLAVLLVVSAGLAGWLAAPEVREALGSPGGGRLQAALAANLGGCLAAVAFVRGMAHARVPQDPGSIGNLLGVGVPGLALAAMAGGMAAEPWRRRFLDDAQGAVLVFIVAGLLALALSRLTMLDARLGVDWRRNPAWLVLLVVLLVAVAAAAGSISTVAGPVVVALLGVSIPVLLVAGVVGMDRRGARVLLFSVLFMILLVVLLRFAGAGPSGPADDLAIGNLPTLDAPAVLTAVVIGLMLLAAAGLVYVLARVWMRRRPQTDEDLLEERWIDHGDTSEPGSPRRRRRRRRFGRPAPADAAAAYEALLEDLAARRGVRREAGETPAEHARRLRGEGTGALALDLLAADYGLVRYGGVRLTATEEGRALRRARQLRRSLVDRGGGRRDQPPAGAAPGTPGG